MTPFELGRVMATPGAMELADRLGIDLKDLIARHHSGDGGDIPEDDVMSNLRAILNGDERVWSSYKFGDESFTIITEADRSTTTVLLPEEY